MINSFSSSEMLKNTLSVKQKAKNMMANFVALFCKINLHYFNVRGSVNCSPVLEKKTILKLFSFILRFIVF
jgi:hypothetical protein